MRNGSDGPGQGVASPQEAGHQPGQGVVVRRQERQPLEAQDGVVEHRVGGPGRRPRRVQLGRRDGPDPPAVVAGGHQDVADELVPGQVALVGDVVDARAPVVDQPEDRGGQVVGDGEAPALVVDEGELAVRLGGQPRARS